MSYLYEVHMFKGPGLQIRTEEYDKLRTVLQSQEPPKFVELRGQLVAVSNIAQIERGEPERRLQIEAPELEIDPMLLSDNLDRYENMKRKKLVRPKVSAAQRKQAEAELEEVRKRKAAAK